MGRRGPVGLFVIKQQPDHEKDEDQFSSLIIKQQLEKWLEEWQLLERKKERNRDLFFKERGRIYPGSIKNKTSIDDRLIRYTMAPNLFRLLKER